MADRRRFFIAPWETKQPGETAPVPVSVQPSTPPLSAPKRILPLVATDRVTPEIPLTTVELPLSPPDNWLKEQLIELEDIPWEPRWNEIKKRASTEGYFLQDEVKDDPTFLERWASVGEKIIEHPVTQTVSTLSGIALIGYTGYVGARVGLDLFLRSSINRNLTSWAKSANVDIPKETRANFVDTLMRTANKKWLTNQAVKTIFKPTKAGLSMPTQQAAEVEDDIANLVRNQAPVLIPKGTQTGAMAFGGLGKPAETIKVLPVPADTQLLIVSQALGKKIGLDIEAIRGIAPDEYWVSISTTKLSGTDAFKDWIQNLREKNFENAQKVQHLLEGKFEYKAGEADIGFGKKRFIPFKNIQDANKFLETGDVSLISTSIRLRGEPWSAEKLAATRLAMEQMKPFELGRTPVTTPPITPEAVPTVAPTVPEQPTQMPPKSQMGPVAAQEGITAPTAPVAAPEAPPSPPEVPPAPPTQPSPPLGVPPKPVSEIQQLVSRRTELKELLAKPAKELPKGTTKVQLRQELKGVSDKLKPIEGKLRQSIMAAVRDKGLGIRQKEEIFKRIGKSRHLSDINEPDLSKVLTAVQKARPVKIKSKTLVTSKTEAEIQTTRSELIDKGKISSADYDAILRMLKLKTDKYVNSGLFITETEGRSIIKAMRRKGLIGYAAIEEATEALVKSLGPPRKPPMVITDASLQEPFGKRVSDKLSSVLNRTYRVERILLALDKYAEGGVFNKSFYKPINEATNQKISGFYTKIEDFYKFLQSNKVNIGKVTNDVVEIAPGVRLSSSEKIGVYLSSLNPDNKRHLMQGNKLSEELITTISESLTPKERLIADWLRKYFQNEGPAVSKARMYVEGKPLDLVENYFPIRLQYRANPEFDYWQQITKSDSYSFVQDWASANIPKGFTKERTPEAVQAVDLDAISIFVQHLEAVEHYKAFAPVIGDLQLILKNNAFKNALIGKTSPSVYQVLDKWLKQVAEINPLRPTSHAEQVLRTLRVNAVTAVLGANIVTALKQFPSFASGAAEIGAIPAMQGLYTFLRHPQETRQLIREFSPQIYRRSFEREIAEAKQMRKAGKLIAGKITPQEVFMFMTTSLDKLAVSALWRGGFDDYLKKHPGMVKDAAEYADRDIRKTQPFFDVKDLPEYYRSGEFMKALTIFTNQLNNYWNYYVHDIAGKYGAGQINTLEMLRRILYAFIIPALMIGALTRSDVRLDAKNLAKDFAGMFIATIPIVGSWITSGVKGFSDSGLVTTELLNAIQELSQKISGEKWNAVFQQLPEIAGYALGIPVAQPKRTIKAIISMAKGQNDDLLSLIWGEYTREDRFSDIEKAQMSSTKAVGKLGQIDTEAREKAMEAAETPNDMFKVTDKDWTFTTSNLASDFYSSFRDMTPDDVTEEKGFPPIAEFYMASQKWLDAYYELPEDWRDEYLEDNPYVKNLLYFWGRWKANMPDDVREEVEGLATKYNIPFSAIPAFKEAEPAGARPSGGATRRYKAPWE